MSKRHTVTLHHVVTVYNDIFHHMDGTMRALVEKMTQWKEDLFCAVMLARQKISKYYAGVTPLTAELVISAHLLDPFPMWKSYRKWPQGMDINPEDETSYTTKYQQGYLKSVENEYYSKHRRMPVDKLKSLPSSNLIPSTNPSRSCQSSFDPYAVTGNNEEYMTPNNLAKTTPGHSDRAARWLAAARLYLDLPPEATKIRGQINPNVNDYHSDPVEITSTFWLPHMMDWRHQQEQTHSKYADLSNLAHNIFSIIPYGVGVEASSSLGRDGVGWRQS